MLAVLSKQHTGSMLFEERRPHATYTLEQHLAVFPAVTSPFTNAVMPWTKLHCCLFLLLLFRAWHAVFSTGSTSSCKRAQSSCKRAQNSDDSGGMPFACLQQLCRAMVSPLAAQASMYTCSRASGGGSGSHGRAGHAEHGQTILELQRPAQHFQVLKALCCDLHAQDAPLSLMQGPFVLQCDMCTPHHVRAHLLEIPQAHQSPGASGTMIQC